MNPISYRIRPDAKDCRRLLLDDGRPVLAVVGGGHERPFTQQELATISAWVCECWNALSAAAAVELVDERGDAALRRAHAAEAQLERSARQLRKWAEWYGNADHAARGQLPLPPAGDVKLADDIAEALPPNDPLERPYSVRS